MFIMRENIAVNNVVYSQIITQSSLVQLQLRSTSFNRKRENRSNVITNHVLLEIF